MANKEYEVVEKLGVFSEYGLNREITKEVNVVVWGDRGYGPVLDIRKWTDGEPGKGISVTDEELDAFFDILKKAYPERFN